MNKPRVSIIIPCRNYGQFLPETLASLEAQVLTDFECICIDNGSTDNTREIVEAIALRDPRFVYTSCPPNGVSAARNVGIAKSKGQYIQFLDADDLLQPNKLSSQVAFLEAHEQVALVYGPARYFYSSKPEELRFSRHEADREWIPQMHGKGAEIRRALIRQNFAPIHSPLIRKTVFDNLGVFDEQLTGFEDWDLFLRIARYNFEFQYLESTNDMSLVRLHEKSASFNNAMMFSHFLPLYQKVIFSFPLPRFMPLPVDQKVRLIAQVRWMEEFWNCVFSSQTKIKRNKNAGLWQFGLLVFFSILAFPLYVLLRIYRKLR